MLAPRLVCLSWADEGAVGLLGREDGLVWLRRMLADPGVLLVGHNVAYDLGVACAEQQSLVPLAFAALAAGRVSDTKIRQRLADIATGLREGKGGKEFVVEDDGTARLATYSLKDLALLHLGKVVEKEDTWRVDYHQLDGMPVELWPEEAKAYARGDAQATLDVYLAQAKAFGTVPDEAAQVRYAFARHLISLWGLRADPEAVARLRTDLEKEQAEARPRLVEAGLVDSAGRRRMAVIRRKVEEAYNASDREVPRTEKLEDPQAGGEVLIESGHPDLVMLGKSMKGAKLLSTYLPVLEARTRSPLGCRYELVATGRSSSSSPNDQNPPRGGLVRNCYVPRAGHVFVSADYDTIELRAWAQACLDIVHLSEMAEALRRGEDLHLALGSQIAGCSYEELRRRYKAGDKEADELRQLSKAANFGFPGGMGAKRFVESCAQNGRKIDLSLAEELRRSWRLRWPEHAPYFRHVTALIGASGEGTVEQLRSGRIRGRLGFCDAANTFFQGLTADGANSACFAVAREQHDPASALFGCRTVVFMHDEIIMEAPEESADAAARRLAAVMVAEMSKAIPDVPITTTPVLMRRWFKGAKPVEIGGRLVPSKPEKTAEGGTAWIADI
jgi:hypothetical protein